MARIGAQVSASSAMRSNWGNWISSYSKSFQLTRRARRRTGSRHQRRIEPSRRSIESDHRRADAEEVWGSTAAEAKAQAAKMHTSSARTVVRRKPIHRDAKSARM